MGRSATAVLVAQDIVAIFILTFAASLGISPNLLGVEAAIVVAKAVLALAIAILVGRFLVRPLFESLAATNNRETFTVVALFIVLAASAGTANAGLSLNLGAFLAGMALSDTPYRQVVQAEIKPFAGLLLGLFFVSVGMGVNLPTLALIWPAVLATALVIMIVKTGVVFMAARLNGWAIPGATQLGFLLSQGSEFTLVVVGIASIAGAMPAPWAGILTSAVALTLIAAPIWTSLGLHIAKQIAEKSRTAAVDPDEVAEEHPVLIFGMTPAGRLAADAMRDHHFAYVAVDSNPERFVLAASDGYSIAFGDARDDKLMSSLGASQARAIVLGVRGLGAAGLTSTPAQPRFVIAADISEQAKLNAEGFRAHVTRAQPHGLEMATDLLKEMGLSQEQITAWVTDQAERHGVLERRISPQEIEAA